MRVKSVLYGVVFVSLLVLWSCGSGGAKVVAMGENGGVTIENDLKKAELRGPVKRVMLTSKGLPDLHSEKEELYNERGFLEREKYRSYSPDESKYSTTYEYDDKGRLSAVSYVENGTPVGYTEYAYNAAGQLEVTRSYQADGTLRQTVTNTYEPNAPTRVAEVKHESPFDEPTIIKNDYDASGNHVGAKYYNADVLIRSEEFTYDGSGDLVSERAFTPEGRLLYRISNAYDDRHRLVVMEMFNSEGTLNSREVSGYDENDNLVSGEVFDNDGLMFRYTKTYVYDAHGNWVWAVGLRQEAEASRPDASYIDERKIEYYK